MPKLPKKRKGMRTVCKVCTLLRLQGTKLAFHPSEKQTIVSIRCQYVPITAKTDIRPIRKRYFEQTHPRLFTNSANQWFAKTIMDRSEHSENSFYTGLQQHSFNNMLVYCFTVVLVYNSETSNKSISNGVRI